MDSDADFRSFEQGLSLNPATLRRYCDTDDGAAFAAKHLHPPGVVPGVAGIPDRDSLSSTVQEWRLQNTITRPLSEPPGGTIDSWNVSLAFIPNIRFLAVGKRWWSTAPLSTAEDITIENDQLDWSIDSQVSLFSGLRPVARSINCELDAAALSNQGKVYSAQYRPATRHEEGGSPVAGISLTQLPSEGAEVTMLSAKSTSKLARVGTYTSVGYSQPVVDYISSNVMATDGSVAALVPSVQVAYNWNGARELRVLGRAPAFDQMAIFLVLFKGLSASATVESIVVQSYEILPAARSAWLSSLTPGATPDFRAMELVYSIRHAMPDAFDSSRNFLGALAGLLGKFLPGIITHVGGVATKGLVGLIERKRAAKAAKKQTRPTQAMSQFSGQALDSAIGDLFGKKRKRSAAAKKRQRLRRKAKKQGIEITPLMQALSLLSKTQ